VPVSLFRYFDFRVTARPRRVHGSDDTVHMQAQYWPLWIALKEANDQSESSVVHPRASRLPEESAILSVMEIL